MMSNFETKAMKLAREYLQGQVALHPVKQKELIGDLLLELDQAQVAHIEQFTAVQKYLMRLSAKEAKPEIRPELYCHRCEAMARG